THPAVTAHNRMPRQLLNSLGHPPRPQYPVDFPFGHHLHESTHHRNSRRTTRDNHHHGEDLQSRRLQRLHLAVSHAEHGGDHHIHGAQQVPPRRHIAADRTHAGEAEKARSHHHPSDRLIHTRSIVPWNYPLPPF